MFARPITEQEWFATSAIAGTAPEPVMIASVPFPRRVKRQKSQGRVKALKAMIRDTVALRADWNLFGPEDDEIQRASVPQRRAVPRQEQRHLVDARRCGLQAWLGKKAAERRALRARIDAEHAALFDEDEALRGTLTFVDEADKPVPPTPAMQLSAHLISVALIAVALPLGVMALVCSLLRGGDMRIAARMSTLTGFAVLALSGNVDLVSLLAS